MEQSVASVGSTTKTFEYIIICQDGLYIASTTTEENLHMLKEKYNINIYLQDKYPDDLGGRDIYQIKEYLEQLYENVNILFHNKLPKKYAYCIPNYQVND